MYRVAFRTLSFAFLALLEPVVFAQADPFLIADAHIGAIHLGMTVDEFYAVYNPSQAKLVDLQLEGMFSPALRVQPKGQKFLTAEIDEGWKISRIRLDDAQFHTAQGLRVGSTFADLKKACPALKVLVGEGQLVARCEATALSFILDSSDVQKPPAKTAKVTSILIVR